MIRSATGAGTASSTSAKTPAASSASASSKSRRAFSAVRPCALKPPSIVADCGVRPMWPITGIPAPTSAWHARERRAGALDLDRVGARLLQEADRVVQRLLVRDLERPERHVGDHERPARAAVDRAREHDQLVHRRGHGRVVAEHGHRRRVADEDDVGARLVGEPPGRRVVGGDHRDRLAPRLQLDELGERQLAGGRSSGSRLARAGGHGVLLVEDDVVDQADGADAHGGGEDGWVEVGDLDVVDVETVEGGASARVGGRASRVRAAARGPAGARPA